MEQVRGLHVRFDTDEITAMTALATLCRPTWRVIGKRRRPLFPEVCGRRIRGGRVPPIFFLRKIRKTVVVINKVLKGNTVPRLRSTAQQFSSTQEVTMAEDTLMTVRETAAYLRLAPVTVYVKANKRLLPSIKIGGRLVFKKSELDEIIRSGSRPALTAPGIGAGETEGGAA